ncbi:MAG TPA: YdeI/OmpD-associated family protein, partial [Chitinophagaceae bacterium]|nr:YdeI/OmpD-associated family protein [Chitinophagaceae bacterium]
TSFRVKGRLDHFAIEKAALLPMGKGKFILTLNAAIRKVIKKGTGASLEVKLQTDDSPLLVNTEFLDCLNDEPAAATTFQSLTKSHQLYFSKWIESAKTEPTKAKRIAMAVNALAKGWGFSEMLRAAKIKKEPYGL